ncbi:uncharacterized protein LOC126668291 [Mercurialis annua]|uniref:uncharacterized protein LOC126668291 n=1 Tax=Mercurialis annua TaxID=3986 RepID=UPI00216004B8|nr:uncharacterized protein LOC126668291 [Mercurialis annua]
MKELDRLDERIKTYLQGIDYERWSRHHSYNNIYKTTTSNLAELLNAAILHARELPITTLLMHLHDLLQELIRDLGQLRFMANNVSTMYQLGTNLHSFTNMHFFQEDEQQLVFSGEKTSARLPKSEKTTSLVVFSPEKMTRDEFVCGGSVAMISRKNTINMKERSCTCKKFEIDEIPCQHTLEILNEMHQEPYKYCSKFWTPSGMLATYSETIFPIEKKEKWEIPHKVKDMIILPSQHRTRIGSPIKRRYKASWEKSITTSIESVDKMTTIRKHVET